MTKEEDIDEFLEHFGVKGMQWGKRNSRNSGSERKKLSSNQKKAIVGGSVVVGAAVVAGIISSRGKTPVSPLAGKPFFSASGPKGSISVGSAEHGMMMTTETLNMLVSSLNRK